MSIENPNGKRSHTSGDLGTGVDLAAACPKYAFSLNFVVLR